MNLTEALVTLASPVARPDADVALRTVGEHLATRVEPAAGAVAVGVGEQGVLLARGAGRLLRRPDGQDVPVHAASFIDDGTSASALRWIDSPPPPGVPIVVFVPHLITGAVVQTLLAGPLGDAEGPMTVAAIDAEERALVELRIEHPRLEVVTAVPRPGADGARQRKVRRCGPLRIWRQARETCLANCLGHHATWPLLRGLGVVPSPRWHTAWYRRLLADAADHRHRAGTPPIGEPDRSLKVIVVNPDDHLLAATLVELAGPVPVDLHVLSHCATPLLVTGRWADRYGQALTVHLGALARRVGPFDLAVVADDSIPYGRTREDDRATIDALVPVVDALAPGAQLAYATRLGPHTMMAHRHEYDDLVRFVQSAAGLGYRQGHCARWQVIQNRWQQPTQYQVYYQSVGITDVLTGAGLTDVNHKVDIFERPSRLLRWHLDELTLGAGSQMYRFTGTAEDRGAPGRSPAATARADQQANQGAGVGWLAGGAGEDEPR